LEMSLRFAAFVFLDKAGGSLRSDMFEVGVTVLLRGATAARSDRLHIQSDVEGSDRRRAMYFTLLH